MNIATRMPSAGAGKLAKSLRGEGSVMRLLRSSCRSLEPGADGRDALGVEAEPVHPAHVARVLNLEAAVHDHRHAAVFGDLRAVGVDHAELAPEGAGVYRHGVPRDRWQRIRRAEDVHDVHRHGY